jgi:hypothetical protein
LTTSHLGGPPVFVIAVTHPEGMPPGAVESKLKTDVETPKSPSDTSHPAFMITPVCLLPF